MAESFGSEFTIVEVTADDFARPYKQIWSPQPNRTKPLRSF